jgi:hypothetical protein
MPELSVVGPLVYNCSAAASILVAHHRRSISGCRCGWSQLGRSFVEHQVEMLVEAELIKNE